MSRILANTKTGAWVRLRPGENAARRASLLGWVDWETYRDGIAYGYT
jgi:hypothetical protein